MEKEDVAKVLESIAVEWTEWILDDISDLKTKHQAKGNESKDIRQPNYICADVDQTDYLVVCGIYFDQIQKCSSEQVLIFEAFVTNSILS